MTITRLPPAATILDALLDPPVRRSDERFEGEFADVLDPVLALHRNNAKQWDREDDARRDDADDAMVASAKRDIDRMNRARHGFIETIDRALQHAIDPYEAAPLVTESPGMAIDRLSVLVIRLSATKARAAGGSADAGIHAERLVRLDRQLKVLEEGIATLLDDLATGTRRFVVYESLKLYGPEDPGRVG